MEDVSLELQKLQGAFDSHVKQNAAKFASYDSLVSSLLPKGNIMADGGSTTDNVRIHNHTADPSTAGLMPAMMAMASKGGNDGLFGAGGGGLLGGLLLGSLLRNGGGLFGGGNTGDANSVMQPTANMSIMSTLGDIKQAVAVGTAQMETSQALQSSTIQAQLSSVAAATVAQVGSVKDAVNSNTVALMQMINGVTSAIFADGEKTRALVTSQYEATLNRQLSDANAAIIELRSERRISDATRATEVNVNTNVNQMQQQQQQQVINERLNQILNAHQYLQQGIVNLGTMSGSAGQQTAANTRVN